MNMTKDLEDHIINIMDCFTGADGGGAFVSFRVGMEDIERQALEGIPAAQEIVRTVKNFSRLINALQK